MIDKIEGSSSHPLGHIGPKEMLEPDGKTKHFESMEKGSKAIGEMFGKKALKEIKKLGDGKITPDAVKKFFKKEKMEMPKSLEDKLKGSDVSTHAIEHAVGNAVFDKIARSIVMDMMSDMQRQQQQLKAQEQEIKSASNQ